MKTDTELEQLAQDIVAGRVYSSYNEGWHDSFMVLRFLDKEQLDELQRREIAFVYEYMDKAGPRSVNGQPVFFSVNYLTKEEYKRLHPRVQEVAKLLGDRLTT